MTLRFPSTELGSRLHPPAMRKPQGKKRNSYTSYATGCLQGCLSTVRTHATSVTLDWQAVVIWTVDQSHTLVARLELALSDFCKGGFVSGRQWSKGPCGVEVCASDAGAALLELLEGRGRDSFQGCVHIAVH